MKRKIDAELLVWKDRNGRLPILLRGARQVGKSFTVETFGNRYFRNVVVANFEELPENERAFESLNVTQIVARLEVIHNTRIEPGQTLLFLDEIQLCKQAIVALRYFKEKMPELHVIGAGSLLEFTLQDESFSFPVGRVQPMFMRPLSFEEFLDSTNMTRVLEQIKNATISRVFDAVAHDQCMRSIREYFLTGGMPTVVSSFLASKSFVDARRIQNALLLTYRSDFGKYAKTAQHKYLQRIFDRAPSSIGQDFKYSHIDPEIRARELKSALDGLCLAGLFKRIAATSASGIPLFSQEKENQVKLLFLDIGLLEAVTQVDPALVFEEDLLLINRGALAEQFVGQELLAAADFYDDYRLHFWHREKTGSKAQVDYVITVGSAIIPIEVKAGSTGRMLSLKKFMSEKESPIGVRISAAPLSLEDNVLSVPFYLIGQLDRLVKEVQNLNK